MAGRPPVPAELRQTRIDMITERQRAGETLTSIATGLGLSRSRVYTILRDAGIPPTRRSSSTASRHAADPRIALVEKAAVYRAAIEHARAALATGRHAEARQVLDTAIH